MGLKCQITYREGQAIVYDKDGQLSQLYMDALDVTGNQAEALNIWATSELDEFRKLTNDENPTLDDVIRFYDTIQSDNNLLNTAETFQIKRFMETNGFSSLSDLYSELQQIFKSDGILSVNMSAAIGSGLYSTEEINNLDISSIGNLLSKIEGQLTKEDIFVEPQTEEFFYKNSDYNTLLGTYEKVLASELEENLNQLINDFSNEEEIYSKIQELPYTDFVENFFSNQNFANDVVSRLKGLRKIPLLSYVGGELTDQNVSYFTTLKNTILSDIDPLVFEANYDYLSQIDFNVWQNNLPDIQSILREIEEQAIEYNIDIIGISEKASDINGVMAVLQDLATLVNSKTNETLIKFSESVTSLLGNSYPSSSVDQIPRQYDGLNVVKLYSSMSADELFQKDGLLMIGENMYHKVQFPSNKSEMYDYLYKRVLAGELIVDTLADIDFNDITNKIEVLERIAQFVMKRDVGFSTTVQEDVSLNQLVFNHLPITRKDTQKEMATLMDISTDPSYLMGPFVSDFYSYILNEKLDNSEIYRTALSKFQINDQDLILTAPVDIDSIEYSQELKDYIRLKKDSSMKNLIQASSLPVLQDLLYLNNTDLIPDVLEGYSVDGNYIITKKNFDSFIKLQDIAYRKVMDSNDTSVYLGIISNSDPLYYDTNLNFSFDQTEAAEILKKYSGTQVESPTFEDFKNTVEQAEISNSFDYANQEDPGMRDPNNLFFKFKYGHTLTVGQAVESSNLLGGIDAVVDSSSEDFYKTVRENIEKFDPISMSHVLSARFQYKYGLEVLGDWTNKIDAIKGIEETCEMLPLEFLKQNQALTGFRTQDESGTIHYAEFLQGYINLSDEAIGEAPVETGEDYNSKRFKEVIAHEIGHAVAAIIEEQPFFWKEEDGSITAKRRAEGDFLKFSRMAGWSDENTNIFSSGYMGRIPRNINTPLITEYATVSSGEAFSEYFSSYVMNKEVIDKALEKNLEPTEIIYDRSARELNALDMKLFRHIKETVFDKNPILEKNKLYFSSDNVEKQNISKVSDVLNSKLELLSLYSPEQGDQILNEIDSCGR